MHLEAHTFFVREWEGEPVETEEMRPEWFPKDAMPYDSMWADDRHWFPRALRGEKLFGKVWFEADGKLIEKMEWVPTADFNETAHEQRKELKLS